jgi:hypothetical protein
MRRAGRRAPYAGVACLLGVCLAWAPAVAQVSEPNGVSAPVTVANGEISLQSYFASQAEAIDAVANAVVEPGSFLPLCDFQATLVLSQSQAQAGIAWYNVPPDPNAAPATVYPIGQAALAVGQTISSADIRSSADYGQGLIGFVLMKNGQRVYYSEYRRNVFCSGCVTPGYWKMALVYQSTRLPNTYYLAFEDWEGANSTTWFGNDGDFNDKVFRISGVICQGGGERCDTGMPGVCANGVTECQPGGTITCKQQIQPSAEICDNLDNDCNGQIDDGPGLCQGGDVCVQGTCVPPCGAAEFDCIPPYVCQEGLCVDPGCIGRTCDVGQVCRAGACVGGCEGVRCPLGQECRLGLCVDPCAGVSCPGAVCEGGACLANCHCRTCGGGQVCAADGHCVDTGCDGVTCPAGQVCRQGACRDACQDASCPGGAACHDGACDMPVIVGPKIDGGAAGTGGGALGGAGGGGGAGGTRGGGGSGMPDAGAGGSGAGGAGRSTPPSCRCTTGTGAPAGGISFMILLAASALARRRRRGP